MFGHRAQKENTVNATPDLATLAAVITCRLLHTTHAFIFNHFQHTRSRFYVQSVTQFLFLCAIIQSEILHKYTVFFVFFIQLTDLTSTLFPFSGQCVECFTSRRLRWFSEELSRPLGVTDASVFSFCERTIRSRTSCSLNFRWVNVLPRDLLSTYAFRIVRSRQEMKE
jgi:hypothetical protein